MIDLSFCFREATQDEIRLFSEKFSNVYRLNPEVKFKTAVLQNENFAVFAIKEENDEARVLFFLILEHPLKDLVNIYNLFCAFIKEMTMIEPIKENLGKSKRICWNLQDRKYHMYFEEIIYKNGGDSSIHTPEYYKDGLFIQYNYERKAWKETINHVERYYYEQKLSNYSEEEKSQEWYSDYKYAVWLHASVDDLDEMTFYLTHRNYDRQNKKIIPLSKEMLENINVLCGCIESACIKYETGTPIWTKILNEKVNQLKDTALNCYDEIWKIDDLNEPYFAETKAKLAKMFRIIRGLKLPPKGV